MDKNEKTSSGYLKIDGKTYAYYMYDHLVTLLPVYVTQRKQLEAIQELMSRGKTEPEFFYGYDGNNGCSRIAFYHNSSFSGSLFCNSPVVRFSTPLIVKANGNTDHYERLLTSKWSDFQFIRFQGGSINALFDPYLAVIPQGKDMIRTPDYELEQNKKTEEFTRYFQPLFREDPDKRTDATGAEDQKAVQPARTGV